MIHKIEMTIDEYNDLLAEKNEPSKLLQETYENTKAKLDEAYKRIKELEESLTQYSIGASLRTTTVEEEYTTDPEINTVPIEDEKEVVHRASTVHRRWTEPEDEIIHKSIDATEITSLASLFSRSVKAVKSRAYALGYKTNNGYIRRK